MTPSANTWTLALMTCVGVAVLAPAAGILAAVTVADWILSPVLLAAGGAVMWGALAAWDVFDRRDRAASR